jgi:hypothetical protein
MVMQYEGIVKFKVQVKEVRCSLQLVFCDIASIVRYNHLASVGPESEKSKFLTGAEVKVK